MPATPDDPNLTGSLPAPGDRTHPAGDADPTRTAATPTTPPTLSEPSTSAAPVQAPALPGFEVLGELGRGATGVVYDARQAGTNRRVALKVVRDPSADATTLLRFLAEAEVVAAVRHPNVVQVYESGRHVGAPFIAMEFLPGGTLADRLRSAGALPARKAASLVAKVARGVAAAHDVGIVHRDVKPGNVLFDENAEPKVADFGLARRGFGMDLTQTGTVMGTPAYMAPEQAAGYAKFVGPEADVWALGVILYECVAGERPFDGDSTAEILNRVIKDEPASLRSHRPDVPRDLETVVGKCLAKEPPRRYPTAAELADDLQRFVRGEPVAARPVGRFERALLWARRKPAVAGVYATTALAVLLAAFAGTVAWLWRDAEHARSDAEFARDEAVRLRGVADDALRGEKEAKAQIEREREQVVRANYRQTLKLAQQAVSSGMASEARYLLSTTPPQLRGWEYQYLEGTVPNIETTAASYTSYQPMAWSPDRRLVLCHNTDHFELLDASTGRTIGSLEGPPASLAGKNTSSWDHTFVRQFRASWSPDSDLLVIAFARDAWVKNAANGTTRARLTGHSGPIRSVAWSPDGSAVLTASEDRTARVWDPLTGRTVRELRGHSDALEFACWSPDGTRVLTICADGTARIWDSADGKPITEFRDPAGWPERHHARGAWSPDGTRVVTVSRDKSARVWNAGTGGLAVTLNGHSDALFSARWNPQGTRIATAGADGTDGTDGTARTARVWNAATGESVAALRGHSVAWSPAEPRLVTIGRSERNASFQSILIWDSERGAEILALPGEEQVHFSADGSRIYTWHNRPIAYDANGRQPSHVAIVAPPPREVKP